LMTPAGRSKANLGPDELTALALDGHVLRGKPSTERAMHLEIYRRCELARCVVHAHPPAAVAWTLARPQLTALPDEAMPELILGVGRIPIVPYARPGTAAMAASLAPHLPAHRVLVLARHGAVAWGESVEEAYDAIERLEHAAWMLKLAEELGGAVPLPDDEVAALRALRAARGGRTL
jgi:L-fuculose-phosphate aldolase